MRWDELPAGKRRIFPAGLWWRIIHWHIDLASSSVSGISRSQSSAVWRPQIEKAFQKSRVNRSGRRPSGWILLSTNAAFSRSFVPRFSLNDYLQPERVDQVSLFDGTVNQRNVSSFAWLTDIDQSQCFYPRHYQTLSRIFLSTLNYLD